MFTKSPCGLTSLIVILPVASSVVIPEMSPFFVFENSSAPTMFVKKPTPGESTRKSRLIAYLKSLGLHRGSVRVLQARAQREGVRQAVRRDLRQVRGQRRDDRGAVRPVHVLVPEEAQVHVPHHAPALHRVRQARIEVVRSGVVDDAEVRKCLLGRTAPSRRRRRGLGLLASSSTGRREEREPGCERYKARKPGPPIPPNHVFHLPL